jgi:hypothetical protein
MTSGAFVCMESPKGFPRPIDTGPPISVYVPPCSRTSCRLTTAKALAKIEAEIDRRVRDAKLAA